MSAWQRGLRRWQGHYWTIAPSLFSRDRAPAAEAWSTHVDDRGGRIRLTGAWREESSDTALVVVHGLGGSVARPYCVRAAQAAQDRSWSCLRLALRGADRLGEDFYHAGLTDDLAAALACRQLRGFRRIFCLGYSLGGHMVLRWALAPTDERVRAVAAICPPLELAPAADHLDRQRIYCRHILNGLLDMYRPVAARGPVPTPVERLARVRSIREWDSLTVVPRFSFRNVDHYYSSQSVGPHLARLRSPTMIVEAEHDPMIATEVTRRTLDADLLMVGTWWLPRGGHVGYPGDLRRTVQGAPGVEAQVLEWMDQHS